VETYQSQQSDSRNRVGHRQALAILASLGKLIKAV
jgi:hypothetical protein